MTTVAMPMASSNLLKRTFDDAQMQHVDKGPQNNAENVKRQPGQQEAITALDFTPSQVLVPLADLACLSSPMPSCKGSPAGDEPTQPTPEIATTKATNKRRKLTIAEQEAKRMEREEKERQRADEKTKKDDEKRLRDIEKEEKRKIKEAHIKQREDERKQKEEEKTKKDKSQLRLNSFFIQPQQTSSSLGRSPVTEGQSPISSRRSSVGSIQDGTNPSSGSVTATPRKSERPDYERFFPPFFLQSHTVVAPKSHFSRDEDGLRYAQTKIDEELKQASAGRPLLKTFDPVDLLHISPHGQSRRRRPRSSVKDLVASIHGTPRNPIDLTNSRPKSDKPMDLLATISMRYLKFAEDVRPPYIGTYTKVSDPWACKKLSRNPFTQGLPTNYDYDSEAEWEEPGEGEDLESEGEEEVGDDDEGDEMEEFLDDEEDLADGSHIANPKHRLVVSDLEPSCTGLCWEISDGGIASDDGKSRVKHLSDLRLEMISDTYSLPIDPYSTAYWQIKDVRPLEPPGHPLHTSMEPPRIPLNIIHRSNNLIPSLSCQESLKAPIFSTDKPAPTKPSKAPKRLIGLDVMDTFKQAVTGSALTKAGLVEVLKKQFPKQSKDAIKDTLGLIAERVGHKEADKRWTIKAAYSTLGT